MAEGMATPKQVMDYFGGYKGAAAFMADWKQLTPEDQAHLKQGIGDGSLTY
jgi:hypothetical protein